MRVGESRFVYWGDEIVRLLQDHPHIDLKAGDHGYVWGVYDLDPPLYEADFYRSDGSGIAMMFVPSQVELVGDTEPVRIPQDVLDFWLAYYKSHALKSEGISRSHTAPSPDTE